MVESTDRQQTGPRGSRPNSGRRDAPAEPKEYQELVINIDRVARVVKGGRRFRFKALVVVGNDKNKVGIGVAKGADVQAAIAKATEVAKKHIINIAIDKDTIPHDCELRYSGAQVLAYRGSDMGTSGRNPNLFYFSCHFLFPPFFCQNPLK